MGAYRDDRTVLEVDHNYNEFLELVAAVNHPAPTGRVLGHEHDCGNKALYDRQEEPYCPVCK